jgi:hypothetical protein
LVALSGVTWHWTKRDAAKLGIPALELSIHTPLGVAVDGRGNVYFSEYANNRVWRVAAGGRTTVVAGDGIAGFTGNGGPAYPHIGAAHAALDGRRACTW